MMQSISYALADKYMFVAENWRESMRIEARKLIIQVHNTWTSVEQHVVDLMVNKDGTELETKNILKLENVFIDKNIALVFILEYNFKIKTGKSRHEFTKVRTMEF
jgi:hypothetical protein